MVPEGLRLSDAMSMAISLAPAEWEHSERMASGSREACTVRGGGGGQSGGDVQMYSQGKQGCLHSEERRVLCVCVFDGGHRDLRRECRGHPTDGRCTASGTATSVCRVCV